jgi:glycosyltransferase involved in cell wall biosynthesis
MRILVLSPWYLPRGNPRSFRWSALAEHWAAAGHRVDVVSSWVPGTPRAEVLRGVRVHRVGGGLSARLRSRFGNVAAHPGEPRRDAPPRGPASLLTWVNNRLWRNLWWPDYACLWYRPALRAARRLLAEADHEALVTVSDPFTSHLVGLRLRRRRPGIAWVADIGDPFSTQEVTPCNNLRLYRRLNRRAEGRVLAGVTSATVTSAGLLESYRAAFPAAAEKMLIVPPLLSAEPPGEGGEPVFPADGKLRLVTVGTLYRAVRDPDHLLALFAKLLETPIGGRLELHFFGNTADCAASFDACRPLLGTRIFLHGVVPRERALAAMAGAACLVHLGNATASQLPSKVVEYAAAGKPLVNLVSTDADSSAAFLRGHPAVLTLSRADGEGLESQARRLAAFIEHPPPIDRQRLDPWLDGFRVGAVAARYEGLLRGDSARMRP